MEVQGAGWLGRKAAAALRAAGASVRLVGTPREGPSEALFAPFHPEHPHRFEAALARAAAAEITIFILESRALLPELVPCGLRWRRTPADAADFAPTLAAARRMGIQVEEDGEHLVFPQGGRLPLGVPEAVEPPGEAELRLWTRPGPAIADFLADKVAPALLHRVGVTPAREDPPELSRHATVWSSGAWIAGARWADPFQGEGGLELHPRVVEALGRLAAQDHGAAPDGRVQRGLTWESCDGLPLVGPVPGRPREILLCGFGLATTTYGPAALAHVLGGLLDQPGPALPPALAAGRMV